MPLVTPQQELLILVAALSVVTFAAYARDKAAARRGGRRTPEATLQLLALLGGWPGALLARRLLRHKSAKLGFTLVLWLCAALHTAASWLLILAIH